MGEMSAVKSTKKKKKKKLQSKIMERKTHEYNPSIKWDFFSVGIDTTTPLKKSSDYSRAKIAHIQRWIILRALGFPG